MKALFPSMLYWSFMIMLLAGIVARIVWYASRKLTYFPDWRICDAVHKNRSGWWQKATELLTYKPQATVLGFMLTPIWFLLVGLNVLLLAQVLEVFFGGGSRIKLPLVGSYTVFPLILGTLFAISETVLEILREKIKGTLGRVLLILLLSSMVLAESGLAYYRAWLLSAGEEMLSPSMMDLVIYRVGPILAAIIAFCVPVAEILSGKHSFQEFFEPMVKASLSWFGGIVNVAWCVITWWLFGFHSIPPQQPVIVSLPQWFVDFKKTLKDLKERTNYLKRDISNLRNKYKSLPSEPQSIESLKKRLEPLKSVRKKEDEKKGAMFEDDDEILLTKRKWEKDTDKYKTKIKEVDVYSQVVKIKNYLKRHKFLIAKDIDELHSKALQLAEDINRAPKNFKRRDEDLDNFDVELKETEDSLTTLKNKLTESSQRFIDIEKFQFNTASESTNAYIDLKITLKSIENSQREIENELPNLIQKLDKRNENRNNNKFSKEKHDALTNDITSVIKKGIPLLKRDGLTGLKNLKNDLKKKKYMLIKNKLRSFLHLKGKKNDGNLQTYISNKSSILELQSKPKGEAS